MAKNVVLYIAMSLDGYIATKENDISFLSMVEQEGEDYGYSAFLDRVDTVIIGRKSYEKVLEMGFDYPHVDKEVYILTRTPKAAVGNFKFYTGDIDQLIADLKGRSKKNIYCDGGAQVVNLLLKSDLIDEYIISIVPLLLGDGIRLFKDGGIEHKLQLVSSKAYEKGLVQLHYVRNRQ